MMTGCASLLKCLFQRKRSKAAVHLSLNSNTQLRRGSEAVTFHLSPQISSFLSHVVLLSGLLFLKHLGTSVKVCCVNQEPVVSWVDSGGL